ncbi:MFS transporter [Streptomyces sp. NBC_01537]|uniref:MFS transporter n=1 Tax=Streptomyces sp. NBC_01537 TaxID=2903896 RepID=UPI003863E274
MRGHAERTERAGAEDGTAGPRRRGPVVVALMLAMALAAMESTIISTAVPQIVSDLGGFSVFSWLFSGYLLAVTVTLPVYGKLADTYGRKPVLIGGIAIFLLGSLLCAGAWNMASLIAFRVLQGLGGGAIQGTVQTVAADLYELKERGRIQAALSSVWAASAIAGPLAGGLLAGYADWRWIFLVNLPVGLVAMLLIARHLRESVVSPVRHRVDWPGALGLFVSGGLLIVALVDGGPTRPWLLGGSVAFGALTVWIERHAAEPVIPGWVWRRRVIVGANLGLGMLGVMIIGPTVFLPMYAQAVLGLGPVQAGFVLSVMTLSWPLSAALSNRVYLRIGFRDTAAIGMAAATATLVALVCLPYAGPAWQPALVMLLLGGALGLFQLPLIVGVQSTVPWHERATATSSILFCRQVGQSVGAAVFGAVANATLAARLSGDAPDTVSAALAAHPTEPLRRAIAAAVNHVYLGTALAAAVALVIVLAVMPRRFPVLTES